MHQPRRVPSPFESESASESAASSPERAMQRPLLAVRPSSSRTQQQAPAVSLVSQLSAATAAAGQQDEVMSPRRTQLTTMDECAPPRLPAASQVEPCPAMVDSMPSMRVCHD